MHACLTIGLGAVCAVIDRPHKRWLFGLGGTKTQKMLWPSSVWSIRLNLESWRGRRSKVALRSINVLLQDAAGLSLSGITVSKSNQALLPPVASASECEAFCACKAEGSKVANAEAKLVGDALKAATARVKIPVRRRGGKRMSMLFSRPPRSKAIAPEHANGWQPRLTHPMLKATQKQRRLHCCESIAQGGSITLRPHCTQHWSNVVAD